MKSYRFLSGQEPSDEMLRQIMVEVAEEAVERRKKADEEHFSQMRRNAAAKKEKWAERINRILERNGEIPMTVEIEKASH